MQTRLSIRDIIKISSRDPSSIRKELESLRVLRNRTEQRIERLKEAVNTMSDKVQKQRTERETQKLDEENDWTVYKIQQLEQEEDASDPARAERRKKENKEIANWGFTIVQHADTQYNERFEPFLNHEQLMKLLQKLNLKNKIKSHWHDIIKLMDNFWVAVEDRKVITFRWDDSYYNAGAGYKNPPKYKLPIEGLI